MEGGGDRRYGGDDGKWATTRRMADEETRSRVKNERVKMTLCLIFSFKLVVGSESDIHSDMDSHSDIVCLSETNGLNLNHSDSDIFTCYQTTPKFNVLFYRYFLSYASSIDSSFTHVHILTY
ncbi:hypothetical protein R6Q59_018637 [Mikania micrantha]